jgi:hypothetical protein
VAQFKLIKFITMKKVFALLSVAAVATLASCGGASTESASTDSTAVVVDSAAVVPAADSTVVADSAAVVVDSAAAAPAAH